MHQKMVTEDYNDDYRGSNITTTVSFKKYKTDK